MLIPQHTKLLILSHLPLPLALKSEIYLVFPPNIIQNGRTVYTQALCHLAADHHKKPFLVSIGSAGAVSFEQVWRILSQVFSVLVGYLFQ